MSTALRQRRRYPSLARARLNRMLDEARRAAEMPWDARTARSYESAFSHFANWLPAEEAAALCAAFGEELERLKGG